MLSDIISSIIMPPGLFIIILLVLSLYALKKPRRIVLASFLLLLTLAIYITSIPVTTFYLNKWFIDGYTPMIPPDNAKAAIIVLGGGSSNDKNGKPFQPGIATMERLYVGIKLAKEHPSFSYLILSGGDVLQRHNITEAEIMESAAKIMDSKAHIILEKKSRNTDENLKFCASIIKKIGVKNVIIVTNNFHIRRAMDFAYLYMPQGINIYPYPSGGRQNSKITYSINSFLPNMRALAVTRTRLKEVLGAILT